MKLNIRKNAITLRKKGYSYSMIADALGVGKSTLSHWLRHVPYTPNDMVLKRVNKALMNFVMRNHQRRASSFVLATEMARREIRSLSKRDILMLGIGLYIGEGSKVYENTQIINSDPNVIRLAVQWFHGACDVPMKNFSLRLHLYPDTPEKDAQRYWSLITGISRSQFEKSQIDTRTNKSRKKRRTLPHGTACLIVRSCGNKKFGVLLHRRILAWIQEIYKKV